MAIHPISQSSFNSLVDTRVQQPMLKTTEHAWFATESNAMLGAVVFDGTDGDWNYVILERAKDNRFRWVEGNTCIESKEQATQQLLKAMENRGK